MTYLYRPFFDLVVGRTFRAKSRKHVIHLLELIRRCHSFSAHQLNIQHCQRLCLFHRIITSTVVDLATPWRRCAGISRDSDCRQPMSFDFPATPETLSPGEIRQAWADRKSPSSPTPLCSFSNDRRGKRQQHVSRFVSCSIRRDWTALRIIAALRAYAWPYLFCVERGNGDMSASLCHAGVSCGGE